MAWLPKGWVGESPVIPRIPFPSVTAVPFSSLYTGGTLLIAFSTPGETQGVPSPGGGTFSVTPVPTDPCVPELAMLLFPAMSMLSVGGILLILTNMQVGSPCTLTPTWWPPARHPPCWHGRALTAHRALLVPGGEPVWELPLHHHHPLQRGLRLLLRRLPHRQGGCKRRGSGGRGGQSWEQLGHIYRHIGDTAESLLGPRMETHLGPEQLAGGSLSLSVPDSVLVPSCCTSTGCPCGPCSSSWQPAAPGTSCAPSSCCRAAASPTRCPPITTTGTGGLPAPCRGSGERVAGSHPAGSGSCPLGRSGPSRGTQGDGGPAAGCGAGAVPAPTEPTRTSSPRERLDPRRHPWNRP